ncbi:NADP-dependent 3-hydroxy acid dehydrogenase YdfG [Quadrisphaera granulorum]|uniref:NADP-dependent 3-hydroxy acid dehydrogenase YdfG n=1 Tax=Quadrisphaera granulorum TaxID=317664 RepID=A0A316AAS3_9ACTN|nr:SDR family oxidoreductase [Quadrisphaera granulorum]PWJ53954.1 NADP-dependent 3-hydroxy acid dehydrogenase YdfG [Quadrisphaera granulorum]SZE96411.1 NADP-dependent 3-hydroxy acid dehydrogenase YdfG [Quadrisphaera granulorum]
MSSDVARTSTPTAVVTGASSGIGAATVRRLRAEGFHVLAVARRADRLEALAAETGAAVLTADLTHGDDVARLRDAVQDRFGGDLTALVNNAGGAFGTDTVEHGKVEDWQRMFDVNVLATLRVTQALLPALRTGRGGDVLVMSSTAARIVYEGGGGYTAAKHAEAAIAETLRLELAGDPVRVLEVAPGMVKTEEFSLNRTGGDSARADAVYAGVKEPLVAEDIADVVAWMLTRPRHVNVDLLVVRPLAQAAQHKVVREKQ